MCAYISNVGQSDRNMMIILFLLFLSTAVLCPTEQGKSFSRAEDAFVQESAIQQCNRQIQRRDSKE